MRDAKKEKERLRKQQWRAALTQTPPPRPQPSPPPPFPSEIYKKHLESDCLRKQHSKTIKSFETASSSSSNSQSPECSECEDGKLCELATDVNWPDSNSDSDSEAKTNKFHLTNGKPRISMS